MRNALTSLDLQIMQTVHDVGAEFRDSTVADQAKWGAPQMAGWVTSARAREELGSKSLETRRTLQHLSVEGIVEVQEFDRVQFFRLTSAGERLLQTSKQDGNADVLIDSSRWTGLISAPQISQVLRIVSEIEDVAETILDNSERAQIIGLVSAIKILLDLPEPPRMGLMSLLRDPAFANILAIGTLITSLIAALKA